MSLQQRRRPRLPARAGRRAGRRIRSIRIEWARLRFNVPPKRPAASPNTKSEYSDGHDPSAGRSRRPSSGASPAWRRRRGDGGADGARVGWPPGAAIDVDFGGLDPVDALLGRGSGGRQLQPAGAARGRRAHHDGRSTTPSCRARVSSRRRPGDRRWSRRWRRCAAPATSCWPRSRCSRSRPTCTAARGRPRRGPRAQRHRPGPRPPAAGPPGHDRRGRGPAEVGSRPNRYLGR